MTESRQLINEIESIREDYFLEVGEGKRRAWPKAIKERILKLCELGEFSTKDIARLTKVSYEVISQWKYLAKKAREKSSPFHSLPVISSLNQSQPPAITKAATVTATDFIKTGIKVATPDGYVVEGLTPEAAVLVIRGLKGARDVF
jgi:transposase-like protein